MIAIDLLLELLNEKKTWHKINEITAKASLNEKEASTIINFLARFKFIILNEHGQKAKITEDTHKFLKEIREEEGKNSIQGLNGFSPRRSTRLLYAPRKATPSSVIW